MRKKILYENKLPINFTIKERDLIREHTFYDPNFGKLCALEGKSIRVDLSLDEIEDIQGFVAAEANHCDDPKLVKQLDKLFEKLQVFFDRYEVVDD